MPGFVQTKRDEERWSRAKRAVSRSKNKDEKSFTNRDWGLVNYLYHKMGKTSEDESQSIEIKEKLIKSPSMEVPGDAVPNPMKAGEQATVKRPKPKKMPDSTDKPSVFFKSENTKLKGVEKLRFFFELCQV